MQGLALAGQVIPPGDEVTVYPVIEDRPSIVVAPLVGGNQLTVAEVAEVTPAVTPSGCPGGVPVTDAATEPDVESPTTL